MNFKKIHRSPMLPGFKCDFYCSKHHFSWSAKICQIQSTACPTSLYLWKPTGEHGLLLFSFFYNWSIFVTFPQARKEARKDFGMIGCNNTVAKTIHTRWGLYLWVFQSSKNYLKEVLEHHYFSITENCILLKYMILNTRDFSRLIF